MVFGKTQIQPVSVFNAFCVHGDLGQLLARAVGQGKPQLFLAAKTLVNRGGGGPRLAGHGAKGEPLITPGPPQILCSLKDPFFQSLIGNSRHKKLSLQRYTNIVILMPR